MSSNPPSQTLAVSEAAEAVGVSIHSLRRWAEWHAAHLSPGANPAPGQPKRFTGRDIEVLRHVKALRSEGLQTVAINATLAGLTFAEIDTDPDTAEPPGEALTAPPAAQDGQHAAAPLALSSSALERVEARLDRLERSREPSFVVGIGLGAIGMGLLFLLIIGVALLYGGFR